MSGNEAVNAWLKWRSSQDIADDRDLDARDAFKAGWDAAPTFTTSPRRAWHESLTSLLIAVAILAAICYYLAGAPH